MAINRSDLIKRLSRKLPSLSEEGAEELVKHILDHMSETVASGQRIEIRGFGSFDLSYREPRLGRNPKTGEPVEVPGKHKIHFKPGKALKERVQKSIKN